MGEADFTGWTAHGLNLPIYYAAKAAKKSGGAGFENKRVCRKWAADYSIRRA